MGADGARTVQTVIEHGKSPQAGSTASLIGIAILLFGASSVFSELQSGLNKVWGATVPKGSGILALLKSRLISFALVLSFGFLLLVSLLFSAALAAFGHYLSNHLSLPRALLTAMDEPAFPGCRLSCRPIGIIEGEQGDKKDSERNDRLVCVEHGTHSYTHIRHVDDLGKAFEKELEDFFVNYHELVGKTFRVLGVKGPAQALRQVKACRKSARRHAPA